MVNCQSRLVLAIILVLVLGGGVVGYIIAGPVQQRDDQEPGGEFAFAPENSGLNISSHIITADGQNTSMIKVKISTWFEVTTILQDYYQEHSQLAYVHEVQIMPITSGDVFPYDAFTVMNNSIAKSDTGVDDPDCLTSTICLEEAIDPEFEWTIYSPQDLEEKIYWLNITYTSNPVDLSSISRVEFEVWITAELGADTFALKLLNYYHTRKYDFLGSVVVVMDFKGDLV